MGYVYIVNAGMEYEDTGIFKYINISEAFASRDDAINFINNGVKDKLSEFITMCTDDLELELSTYNVDLDYFTFKGIELITKSTNCKHCVGEFNKFRLARIIEYMNKHNSPEEVYEFILDHCAENIDRFDMDLNLYASEILLCKDDGAYDNFFWGYKDIFSINCAPKFNIGDAVVINDEIVAIVVHSNGRFKESNDLVYWYDGYWYSGYYITNTPYDVYRIGRPFAYDDVNTYHMNIKKYAEKIEIGSYLWVIKEIAIGNINTNDCDIWSYFIPFPQVTTGVYPYPLYKNIPLIRQHIQQAFVDKPINETETKLIDTYNILRNAESKTKELMKRDIRTAISCLEDVLGIYKGDDE